jgi:predicted nucleic acid-binding protein
LLDVIGQRQPHYAAAAALWSLAESGKIKAFISAISFNNVYYIVRKASGKTKAMEAMRLLYDVFEPVALDAQILRQAIDSGGGDFEDAVQYASALRVQCRHFVTRNPDDFPQQPMSVLSPAEFLATIRLPL